MSNLPGCQGTPSAVTLSAVTRFAVTLSAVTLSAVTLPAQAVRDLGPIVARTAEPIGQFFGMWPYSDGRVLANDIQKRRLILFDSTFKSFTVVADTMGATSLKYGVGPARIVQYSGDSVLMLDFPSGSMVLLGPGGVVVRMLAPPKASDLALIGSSAAGVDAKGRLFYRGIQRTPPRIPGAPPPVPMDSAPIVRADFETRSIDTIGRIRTPTVSPLRLVRDAEGKIAFKQIVNPVTIIDEWAALPDGSVALIRGQDYHIDWVDADGTKRSTPKMSFDWRRMTDEDKQALIDSARRAVEARATSGGTGFNGYTLDEARARGFAPESLQIVTLANGTKIVPLTTDYPELKDIPDYVASIRPGAMRADADGNLWILPTTSARSRKGGLVYDIVNRRGEITERIELPAGRSIVGFARGGVVYLLSGDRGGLFIERANFR